MKCPPNGRHFVAHSTGDVCKLLFFFSKLWELMLHLSVQPIAVHLSCWDKRPYSYATEDSTHAGIVPVPG